MSAGTLVTEEVLRILRTNLGLPRLELVLKEEWSSKNPEFRQRIRESLLKAIGTVSSVTEAQREELLDLMRVPSHPHVGISISHNQKCGGFVIDPDGNGMGLDAELIVRVKEKVVARAAKAREMAAAPSAADLWTAKEAALKCLNGIPEEPEVLSQVEIGEWQKKLGSKIALCRVVGVKDKAVDIARGCVLDLGGMKVAVFRRLQFGGKDAVVTD